MDNRCPGQDARYLKPEDVFEEPCPSCGEPVEFFRSDRSQKCPSCNTRFRNPRLDLGCAAWCRHAKECIDFTQEGSADASGSARDASSDTRATHDSGE